MKYGKKRTRHPTSEPNEGLKLSKFKNGRNEMRNVTRTARRPSKFAASEEQASMSSEEEEEENLGNQPEIPNSKAADIPAGAAYNALLTLLGTDDVEEDEDAEDEEDKVEEASKENVDNSYSEKAEKAEKEEEEEEEDDDDENDEENEIAGQNLEASDAEDEGGIEVDDFYGEEEGEDQVDAFEKHFNNQNEEYLDKQAQYIKENKKWPVQDKQELPNSYTCIFQSAPDATESPLRNIKSIKKLKDFSLKNKVYTSYQKHYEEISEMDSFLLEPMLQYSDVLFPYKAYDNTFYRKLYALHAVNHIMKTRDKILKNNNKLHAYNEALKSGKLKPDTPEPEFRDQGFTRPKVLILLPTRESAYEIVQEIIKLSSTEQQENKSKLVKQFHDNGVPPEYKPDDFQDAFKGNNNDFFCLGIKFTRKSLKLYSSFYSSDIIIASPIGLSMILENPDKKKRQYDFLSSIEVLIVDKAHMIEMQNWDHMVTVMKYVNKIPKEFHDADFSRIRMWCINDQSKLLRQTLVFAEYSTPSINNLISSKSQNIAGKLKFKYKVSNDKCILNSIGLRIKQLFQRYESPSPMEDPDTRFKYFINTVLPSLMKTTSYNDGMLIYIPSYYDYLRIKNHMDQHTKVTFASIDEYSSQSQLSRARNGFASGKVKILLYTERLHYFRRFEIGGVKNLIMYGPPTNPLFYKDLAKFIGKSVFKEEADINLSFMKVIFSKWDTNILDRIVGSNRAGVLCNSPNEIFEFR